MVQDLLLCIFMAEASLVCPESPSALYSQNPTMPKLTVLITFLFGRYPTLRKCQNEIAGDKKWSEEVYSNIGYYFASQGIVTVGCEY